MAALYPQPNTTGDPFTQANNYISNAPRGIDQGEFALHQNPHRFYALTPKGGQRRKILL
jgi:hypothetical protein